MHLEFADYTLAPEKSDFGWQFVFLVSSFAIHYNGNDPYIIQILNNLRGEHNHAIEDRWVCGMVITIQCSAQCNAQ